MRHHHSHHHHSRAHGEERCEGREHCDQDSQHSRHGRFSRLHDFLHAIGRHGHRGHSHHGRGGHHGFGGEGDGMPRGRMVSSEDLQLLLLALLDAEPRHGYELIKALQTLSNGFYSPSPGMVYPALTYLEEIGYVSVQQEGNRKRYAVAEAGQEFLAEHKERAEGLLTRLKEIGSKMDSVRRAFSGEGADADDDPDGRGWREELREVRHALKDMLRAMMGAPAKRQREAAAILKRALADIQKLD